MSGMEIVDRAYHQNGSAAPFVVAIVDDPSDGDVKIVIMFEESEHTAVLSLDKLLEEDISVRSNGYHGDRYERKLREHLWDL